MKVSEIFYSLQGEGFRAGHPSIFIRLAGCDLACTFCDTEFESGKEFTNAELLTKINAASPGCKWIVWTGGEPALQLTTEIVDFFKAAGYQQAVETNGNNPVPQNLDWIACSPKVAEHVVAKYHPNGVHELRYVRHSGQPAVPEPRVKCDHKYLSPRFDGERPNPANLQHCIQLCLDNPDWKLSVQSHKLTRIL